MGYGGLLKEDEHFADVNLDDLENSSGERQEYWLVVICAAGGGRFTLGHITTK
jgi:hypothetical protein